MLHYVVAVVQAWTPREFSSLVCYTSAGMLQSGVHGRMARLASKERKAANPPCHVPCPDWETDTGAHVLMCVMNRACVLCLANPDSESLSFTCNIIPHIVLWSIQICTHKKKLRCKVKLEKIIENDKYVFKDEIQEFYLLLHMNLKFIIFV